MSSRALRKAQREREEQEQLRKLQEEHEEQDEGSEEEEAPAAAPPKQSLFAMLNEDGADDEDDAEDEDEDVHQDESEQEAEKPTPTQPTPKPSTKSKKKKKKAKKAAQPATSSKADASLDDIDLALKSLSTKASGTATPTNTADPNTNEVCRLLSIDTASLHAANEMRRLFGRGRSDGLAALSRRRNIFIQGKEEWPVATSGGLGMEVIEKRSDGTVEYAFVHSRIYQDVQGQFETCVASMDPQRMVLLLQHNPYHISTLLQVSEIAKQERDHTTSGDLLERALFSFGRAVHSTFSANLQQGKARLDFRRPENREFWLAACRYISNLGMRSTWRTVYEWSKLLLSLDPENDPYCISLVIDQYAIRGRQPQNFLDLVNNPIFTTKWKHLPNVQLSRALAFIRVGNAAKGKQSLYTAVSRFPWVVARLFQELNLDPPPSVWGKSPRTDSEKLHSEVYAIRAKDLWNTPEASELLVEVSSAVSSEVPEPPVVDRDITLDEGRHILMSDMPTLIALLPRSITAKVTSASDPLPPQDNQATYTPASTQRVVQPPSGALGGAAESLRELQGLYRFFSELFPWFNPTGEGEERPQPSEEEIERRIAESGVSEEVIVQRTQRLMDLQQRLISVGEPEAGAEAALAVDDE
ncbi:DUF654-domain-containing protein [Aureobasidium pullulans EXF-150]|uniref:DUF654-domain-containing protein n=1 Tax=Aureobasidium pullulans EXF-150 TaxID=1043002 RepID=A0A074XXB9_AURPU|nr:DUF654-domain-containing protein [Aureobasidium pullulans EXF-150]KEQ79331.1 DUF654-domain-containing protein [Aureobasidium pullulans EXF-150]